MSETTTGEIEAIGSRHDGEFGLLIKDDWYNGDGNAPGNVSKGDKVTVEYELTEGDDGIERILVDDGDSIKIEEKGSGSSGNGSGTAGTKDDRAVSRQSAAKTVGNMFQGDSPDGAEDLLRRYRIIEDIAHFNIRGEWPDRVESGQMAVQEVPDDVEDKLEDLSERLGQIEEAGGPEAASVEDFNELHDDVEDLEKKVSNLETLIENVQEGMKSLKDELQDDEDVIFGDDEEENSEDDEDEEAEE